MTKDELIEKILDLSISSEEKILLKRYMDDDPDFKSKILGYQDILKGIKLGGRNKIKEEILSAIDENSIAFENYLKKALILNNRNNLKNEIQGVINSDQPKQTKIISFLPKRIFAIAASIALLILAALYIFTTNNLKVDPALVQKINLQYQAHINTVGLIDIDKEYKTHMVNVFNYIIKREYKKANDLNEDFFKNRKGEYKYYRTQGLINGHQNNFKKAIESYETAIRLGDICVSKFLLASIYGKNSEKSIPLITEIRNNPMCMEGEHAWIKTALNEF